MNEFTKQTLADEKYKQIRNAPPNEYTGDFNTPAYKEVPNNAIHPTKSDDIKNFSTQYKEDFDKASKDFWQKNTQTGLTKYNGGSLVAKFMKTEYTVEELLKQIGVFLKESIANELIEKKIQTDELTENFNAVNIALKLLAKNIQKLDTTINVENISAYLHGFINSYISNLIHKKIERDTTNVEKK